MMIKIAAVLTVAIVVLCIACGPGKPASKQAVHYPAADTPAGVLYVKTCGHCHVAPLPASHVAAVWSGILERMQVHMAQQGVKALTREQLATIIDYLQANSKR